MTPPTLAPSSAADAPSLPAPDAVAAAAVDLARAAAEDIALPGTVGEYQGAVSEGVRLVTHRFECTAPGYRGWRWSVTVARAPRARVATVCEAVLLPAQEAVLAPPWLPWSERVAPGDLGASDVLAYRADDPFLEPGYTATDEEDADRLALWELGLGRARVLSREGRADAARRWYEGSHGPTADVALHASAACSTCGYFLELAGSMRQAFGVCANEWSPSDGTVVTVDHGCGAHSESDVEANAPAPVGTVLDDGALDALVLHVASDDVASDPVDVASAGVDVASGPDDVTPVPVGVASDRDDEALPLLDAHEAEEPVVLTEESAVLSQESGAELATGEAAPDEVVTDVVFEDAQKAPADGDDARP